MPAPNMLDRWILAVAPVWGAKRLRSRAVAEALRHFEAAQAGRRTSGWTRTGADANAANGPALSALRAHARDLVRNNAWAAEALAVAVDYTVGCGIVSRPVGASPEFVAAWKRWSETTDCDADGNLTFYGVQALAMRTMVEAGEVLIRRRRRRPSDGLSLPFQIQVLEPDFIDTGKDGDGEEGGKIVQGVEFDAIGRRVAYWLFEQHPGSNKSGSFSSRRVTASDIIHLYRVDRPGQVRGPSWFAPVIVGLKDFDEYEDAQLVRQKIAACFAAFITDTDGDPARVGSPDATDSNVERITPGMVQHLAPGQDVKFGAPPVSTDDGFSTRMLRKVAAGLGVTYEDMSGDYSQVNFSSGRMGRLKFGRHVDSWRWHTLIPRLCCRVWDWAVEAALVVGLADAKNKPTATWTPPPMPMLEPDKEGLALARLVRAGAKTPSQVVREQGYDPEEFFAEYKADTERLDKLGIILDSDARKTTQSGQAQAAAGGSAPADDTEDEAEIDVEEEEAAA